MIFPALSKPLISILLVGDHLRDDSYVLNLSISLPLYFSLIVSSSNPDSNPSQATALPSTQERGREVAQQLIPVPLLLWLISRDAVRAGQQCKHQPPFSCPLPALRPRSPSQLHTNLPPLSSVPSSCHGAPSSASLPHGFSMNQQQSPSVQSECNPFLALNILWSSYVYPKINLGPEFQISRGPSHNQVTAILGSNCGYNAAKGLSVSLCLPVSFRSHLWRAI